jgi:DNA mismatch endonuclease (patch repair protein)
MVSGGAFSSFGDAVPERCMSPIRKRPTPQHLGLPSRPPRASTPAAAARMRRVRRRDTSIELRLRAALYRRGLRYFVDRAPIPGWRRRADLVFPRARLAVYVDGCFWHGCPEHATWPKANESWWRAKIETNRRRDSDTDEKLVSAGWASVRVWEHEDAEEAAEKVVAEVARRLSSLYSP